MFDILKIAIYILHKNKILNTEPSVQLHYRQRGSCIFIALLKIERIVML
jgi:hypothetical protein